MKAVMSVSYHIQAVPDRVEDFLTMLTTLEPRAFRGEVREQDRSKGAGKDSDEMGQTMHEVKEKEPQRQHLGKKPVQHEIRKTLQNHSMRYMTDASAKLKP